MRNRFLKRFRHPLESKARVLIILHTKKVSAHIGTEPSMKKFLSKRQFGAFLVTFKGPKTNFSKIALKHARSVPKAFCELFGV